MSNANVKKKTWMYMNDALLKYCKFYAGHLVEHRVESTLFITSCQGQSAIGNETSTVSNFCKLFSSIMCWQ